MKLIAWRFGIINSWLFNPFPGLQIITFVERVLFGKKIPYQLNFYFSSPYISLPYGTQLTLS